MIDEMISPPASLQDDDEWVKFVKSVVRVCTMRFRYFITLTVEVAIA